MSAQIKLLQSKPFRRFHTTKKLFLALWFPTICVFTRQKSITALALLVFTFTFSLSHAQSWQWAKSAGGFAQGNEDEFTATAVDDSGNVYVAGKFKDLGWFDSLQLNAEGTNFDAFVAKYSCQGQLRWVRRIEGPGYAEIDEMTLDADQNPVILGNYGSNQPMDSITLDDTTYYQTQHPFLIQIKKTGKRGWIHFPYDSEIVGKRWKSFSNKMTLLSDGKLALLSWANGLYSPTDSVLPGVSLIKYSPQGKLLSVKRIGTEGQPRDLKLLANGNLAFTIAVGNVDTVSLLGETFYPQKTALSIFGEMDINGNKVWLKTTDASAANPYGVYVEAFRPFQDGYILFGTAERYGTYNGDTLFTPNSQTRTSGYELFIMKTDKDRKVEWYERTSSRYFTNAHNFAINSQGIAYMSGYSAGPVYLDTTINSGGTQDITFFSYDIVNRKWINYELVQTTGTKNDQPFDLTIDSKDNVILAGKYEGWLYFDPQGPNKDTLFYKGGNSNAVVLKFGSTDCPVPPPVNSPDYGSISLLGDGFELFPNPSSARVELQIKTEEEVQALRVYTISGQVVYNQKIVGKPESLTLDIAEYKTGVYLVELLGKNNHWVRRLVKVDD